MTINSFGEDTVVPPSCNYSSTLDYSDVFIQDLSKSTFPHYDHRGWVCSSNRTFVQPSVRTPKFPNYQNVVTKTNNGSNPADIPALIATLASKVSYAHTR